MSVLVCILFSNAHVLSKTMSVQCSICTSAFLQSCNVCSTLCGHLFHYSCLLQWLEEYVLNITIWRDHSLGFCRHKTCPQCRDDTNESTIIKIYLTIEEVDGLVQLRDENENLEVQLERKIVELARKEEDIKKLHESNTVKVKALEEKQKNSETQLRLLEEIMEFYKKRNERKCYEIEKLMTRVKEAEAAVMHCEGEDCGRDKPLISRYLRLKRLVFRNYGVFNFSNSFLGSTKGSKKKQRPFVKSTRTRRRKTPRTRKNRCYVERNEL